MRPIISGAGLATALAAGFSLGAIYWGLVLWRGAPPVEAALEARP